jgi:polyphosphate kinase
VEVAFPVLDAKLKKRVIEEGLTPYLLDNTQAWQMEPDGTYRSLHAPEGQCASAQQLLLNQLSRPQVASI